MAARTALVPRGAQGPTRQQAEQFVGMEMGAMPDSIQRTARGGIDFNQDEGNFPASQYPDMKAEDTRMVAKKKVVKDGQNFTGEAAKVTYAIGEDDIRYYEAKAAAQELSAYERWVASRFNFKSPADVDRFAKMFPEYFERRMSVLKSVSDANLRYAQIMLTGAQTSDDYLYLWLVQTGKIPLINGPLWQPSKWFRGNQTSTQMAAFNPLKLVTSAEYWRDNESVVPSAAGVDGNWVYPGLPTTVGAWGITDEEQFGAAIGPDIPKNVPGWDASAVRSFFR